MRKLTEQLKKDIRESFKTRVIKGIPEEHQVLIFADHAIALLELEEDLKEDWYEKPTLDKK